MAKISKTMVDKKLRDEVFEAIMTGNIKGFTKINDRQYGTIMIDLNGDMRYIRIGAIVAELREDMTAQELMQSEINVYNAKQAEKAEKAKAKAEKIAKDKAKREAKAKEAEEQGE